MSDLPVYVLEREFDAPAALVWKTWTDADLLSRWYGPGVETIIHELDVRSGGVWLNEMKMGENSFYQKAAYTDVFENQRLIWLQSMTDADWNNTGNPQMPDWPQVLHTDVTFEEVGGKTKMRLLWSPHEASDAEIACFAGALEGLGRGWGAGMELLEKLLVELQA